MDVSAFLLILTISVEFSIKMSVSTNYHLKITSNSIYLLDSIQKNDFIFRKFTRFFIWYSMNMNNV